MRNKKLYACILLGVVVWVSMTLLIRNSHHFGVQQPQNLYSQLNNFPDRSMQFLQVGDDQLQVEVVRTMESITQGLSGRAEIGSDGMLFIFPTLHKAQFWMPDMQFSIDIVWISGEKIIGISEDVPAPEPGTPRETLPLYPAPGLVDAVLEVPAQMAEQRGWIVGDSITLLSQ